MGPGSVKVKLFVRDVDGRSGAEKQSERITWITPQLQQKEQNVMAYWLTTTAD